MLDLKVLFHIAQKELIGLYIIFIINTPFKINPYKIKE